MSEEQAAGGFSHLHLTGWPFQIVPDEFFSKIWADRSALRQDVDKMINRWTRVDRSTLHLMWADLGAGKTHTLRYIERVFVDDERTRVLPIYAEMPRYVRSFFEVYQAIVTSINLPVLAGRISNLLRQDAARSEIAKNFFGRTPDAVKVLHVLGAGSETQKELALGWFRGARDLTRRHLEFLGVTSRIRSSDDSVAVLSGLVRLIHESGSYRRVLVMLDECQRFGIFRLAVGRDINSSLRSWYNNNPRYFTLVLSFGSGEERFVRHLLSPDIQTIVDPQRLRLDLLDEQEAFQFVGDLLAHFREPGTVSRYFPLSEDLTMTVVRRVTRDGGVTPRVLMFVFDTLLREADIALSNRQPFTPDPADAIARTEETLTGLSSEKSDSENGVPGR